MAVYTHKYINNEEKRKEANTIIIKMMIHAISAVNDSSFDENQIRAQYLLGQIIRQYNIPESNWHISAKAKQLWNEVVTEGKRIDGYDFQQLFSIDENCTRVKIGNVPIERNKSYRFNQLFQAEHIIPVYVIRNELNKLVEKSSPTKENELVESMRKVLENIHICRITRDESKALPVKRNVENTKVLKYMEYYRQFYKKAKITLVDIDNHE